MKGAGGNFFFFSFQPQKHTSHTFPLCRHHELQPLYTLPKSSPHADHKIYTLVHCHLWLRERPPRSGASLQSHLSYLLAGTDWSSSIDSLAVFSLTTSRWIYLGCKDATTPLPNGPSLEAIGKQEQGKHTHTRLLTFTDLSPHQLRSAISFRRYPRIIAIGYI